MLPLATMPSPLIALSSLSRTTWVPGASQAGACCCCYCVAVGATDSGTALALTNQMLRVYIRTEPIISCNGSLPEYFITYFICITFHLHYYITFAFKNHATSARNA